MCFWVFHVPLPFKCNFMCLFFCFILSCSCVAWSVLSTSATVTAGSAVLVSDQTPVTSFCTSFSGKASFSWEIQWLDYKTYFFFLLQTIFRFRRGFLCVGDISNVLICRLTQLTSFFEADEVYGTLALDDVKNWTFSGAFLQCILNALLWMYSNWGIQDWECVKQLPELKRPYQVENGKLVSVYISGFDICVCSSFAVQCWTCSKR